MTRRDPTAWLVIALLVAMACFEIGRSCMPEPAPVPSEVRR